MSFWCEFIDLVDFLVLFCDPCHFTLKTKSRLHRKTAGVRTMSTRRRFAARKPIEKQNVLTRGNVLSSLHCLQAKYIPMHVAGNEHFLAPSPQYLLSANAMIGRVNTGLWPEVKFPLTVCCEFSLLTEPPRSREI